MKKFVIIAILFFSRLSLETHNFSINNYEFPYNDYNDLNDLIKDISNHYNQDFWFIKYIFDICNNYDVDPILMVSLIKIESSFYPYALSKRNAYGYCQITPIANKDVDKTLSRYNPKENIILGVKFIKKLMERFEGDIITALRYYNSGNDYDKHDKSYAENIKYEYETLIRLYLKTNINYNAVYRRKAF